MCWSQTSGSTEISVTKSTASQTQTGVEGRGSSYQAGRAAVRGQPLLREMRGSGWERLHEDANSGEGAVSVGALVGTSQSRKCQSKERRPSFACLQAAPHDYFLALLLDVLLTRTLPNCERKRCARNAGLSVCPRTLLLHLFVWSLTAGPQPLTSLCSQSRLFFFPLCRRTTQSTLSWILLTPPLGACLQALLPLPRHYGIAVWFLQNCTSRNRARHHSSCGCAWIVVVLPKIAALDAVVCCKQLVLVSWSHYRNMEVPLVVQGLKMHLLR